ncbi:SurA N-terminal domain-containing protein [Rhizohabitans arisaemae]|uniref:SurA N-terminal domain-containing protein n=1 Tax=Rhizohabitans arisaemae TaxID=2720610 RepID=UPI0024B1D24B|nr:SurA N-terminal domain-containing protein [Rhizohabitans arisaemae]
MKSKGIRVALLAVAATVALTACNPIQAGSAAIVGNERISQEELNTDVRDYTAALVKLKVPEDQISAIAIPGYVLQSLIPVRAYEQVGRANGVTVTDGEIDAFIASKGGLQQAEVEALQAGVPPQEMRGLARAQLIQQKLLVKFGGGTDKAALKRAQGLLSKEITKLKLVVNPRYELKPNPEAQMNPGANPWLGNDRFGAPAGQEAAAGG